MREIELNLTKPQAEFVNDISTRFIGLCGGYGSGKSYALATKLIILSSLNPGYEGALISPTFSMARDVMVPAIREQLEAFGISYKFSTSSYKFEMEFGRRSTILHILSANNYRRAAGLNLSFFGVDEADMLPRQLAHACWRMMQSRLRKGKIFQGCAVSTPEGYNFLYDYFVTDFNRGNRRLVRARTFDNPFLPREYVESLLNDYPENLRRAYIEGEFVNLFSGRVYPSYDADLNDTDLTLETLPDRIKTLHVAADFNIYEEKKSHGISCVTSVIMDYEPYTIDEFYVKTPPAGMAATDHMIEIIKEKYKGFEVLMYPDATGSANKTSASSSDRAKIRAAGLTDMSDKGNPSIRDSVAAANAKFLNIRGDRKWLVNKNTCPVFSDALMQQPWDYMTQRPLKDGLLDGPCDAGRYFIYHHYPVHKPDFHISPLHC